MANEVYLILCEAAGIMMWTLATIGVLGAAICGPLLLREYRRKKDEEEANRPLPKWLRRMS